jgi:hypothetical protein
MTLRLWMSSSARRGQSCPASKPRPLANTAYRAGKTAVATQHMRVLLENAANSCPLQYPGPGQHLVGRRNMGYRDSSFYQPAAGGSCAKLAGFTARTPWPTRRGRWPPRPRRRSPGALCRWLRQAMLKPGQHCGRWAPLAWDRSLHVRSADGVSCRASMLKL